MAEPGEGRPEPLGVTTDAAGVNVAVVAPDAGAIEFCLFDPTGMAELARHRLPARTGDVWHGHVPGVAPGARYGLRAHGPRDAVHRFNAAKLLVDPWAHAIDRPFLLHPSLFDTGPWPDGEDSAPWVPKGIVCGAPQPASPPLPFRGPRVIYEMHVRGFTKLHPAIPEAVRGTFAALAHPAAIAHLQLLGVTHVELMPCAAGVDEPHLLPLGLTNYWNYNPVALLAPCPKLAPGGMAEIRTAVEALRQAGIGVILDVVFNHTGEGGEEGPTLSLRGLANGTFHRVLPDGRYANDSGCGNTLALDRPWPLRLVMDALRHWVLHAGVDGFRLDLATTLGRGEHGFDPNAPLLSAMRQDPLLRERIMIAEPWDIGPGGYQLGHFPAGWGEWNDRFRDDVRRFWRGDAGLLGALATRLAGSADVFRGARQVTDSVNFITAHDGFTLADLVSYAHRHNWANGEDNRDGAAENYSWNNGAEGPSDDPTVVARRRADARALLATLLLARGTPMLNMGDEAGRSQQGNNNAYCQDNTLSWFDWAGMDEALRNFTARLVWARLRHPALRTDRPLTGRAADSSELPDVAWQRLDGAPMTEADWRHARSLAMLLHHAGDRALMAVHGEADAAALTLPAPRPGHAWRLLVDSAEPEREGEMTQPLLLSPRSLVLLVESAVI
jgi:glycogen debranching enzyme GlgX